MFGLRLFRTLAFRIALAYLALFALSAGALLAFTYWNTKRALNVETDQTIEAEIAGLSEQYQRQGLGGLTDVLTARSIHAGPSLYLLVGPLGHPLAGNLDAWPTVQRTSQRFVEFQYERRVGGVVERHPARGRVFHLAGDYRLMVARDVHELSVTERMFTTTLPESVGLMLSLGLIGGALMSRNLLRRLDQTNSTSEEIMGGNLSRRLPVSRAGDEFDSLAKNLNRMLDRIERLMRGMREVTDSVAHDLRSPLNRLRNRLEGMLKHLPQEASEAAEMESAIGEIDRLIATFNSLLLIAEAEAGLERSAMQRVDLSALARDICELYAPLAEESGLSLSTALAPQVEIDGNWNLLSQAFANLVDNAIKYTCSGGSVTIATGRNEGSAILSVADTGPGIPEEDHARALERFVRLEASRNSPGSGLGLSLVAAVARLHEARLELSNNHPGLRVSMIFGDDRITKE
jgi:signal transduction histidine kinase